jgi:uncharacterized protein DUF2760
LEVSQKYSRISFWTITILGIVILAVLNAGLYYGINLFLANFSGEIGDKVILDNSGWLVDQFQFAALNFYKMVLPIFSGIILFFGWFLWGILRISTISLFKVEHDEQDIKQAGGKKKKDFIDQKIEKDQKRRLFLHSLSILQRDGHLLDFFGEDLTDYDDEQIGMAVRSIHDDCKKAIKKYIDLKPVIDKEEGEIIRVEPGFDMDSIKLVGNVSGEPPFEGVLKHPGWKAGKRDIPKLSDIQNSSIISHAEIEI